MMYFCISLLILIIWIFECMIHAQVCTKPLLQSEFDSLVSLFNSTNGVNWCLIPPSEKWNISTTDLCSPCQTPWYGITCTITANYSSIYGITLLGNCLHGVLPYQISNLTNLDYLNLGYNDKEYRHEYIISWMRCRPV